MDQTKIGRFIAEKRKEHGMTQAALAEKLGVTDRAVSKWETGKSLPDASLMLDLCGMLGITVNDLLCGEVVSMENYNEEIENTLLEMVRQKEETDRRLLKFEVVIGVLSTLFLIAMVAVAAVFMTMGAPVWVFFVLYGVGIAVFLVGAMFAVRIEQTAGYYECAECGHKYVPTFAATFLAPHMGRTRRLKCPACGKKSWQKKVIGKD